MLLEQRMEEAYKNLRAPEGKFAVYVWDPSNSEKSIPTLVGKPYAVRNFAESYVKRMNAKKQPRIGERQYFVVDDQGIRIY